MILSRTDKERLARVKFLFTDIDDTLSTDGRISERAYSAIWRAAGAGLTVVPVTGRPAGWCDHIARMWPVGGVVGENGGLYFRMTASGMEKVFMHDAETRAQFRRRLDAVRREILETIPGCAVASDQPYREYDLAIDYCEDVAPLPPPEVDRIVAAFVRHGAHAKISSVHVNGWFGDFDKLTMVKRFALDAAGTDLERNAETAAFIGDSPNDEPMFAFFPLSFGVANIARFAGRIGHMPTFVCAERSGEGFAEAVEAILAARAMP